MLRTGYSTVPGVERFMGLVSAILMPDGSLRLDFVDYASNHFHHFTLSPEEYRDTILEKIILANC